MMPVPDAGGASTKRRAVARRRGHVGGGGEKFAVCSADALAMDRPHRRLWQDDIPCRIDIDDVDTMFMAAVCGAAADRCQH
jgi:hypothetical protein